MNKNVNGSCCLRNLEGHPHPPWTVKYHPGESLLNMLDENDDDDVEDLLAALNPRDKFLQR